MIHLLFDVDGIVNVLDHPETVMLRNSSGKPVGYIDFDPVIASALTDLVRNLRADGAQISWMTCWNSKTEHLAPLGFPELDFIPVDKPREQESKLDNIDQLLRDGHHVIWVDDFGHEWASTRGRFHVHEIGRCGLTLEDIENLGELVRKLLAQSIKEE